MTSTDASSPKLPGDRRTRTLRGWRRLLPIYFYRSRTGWRLHIAWLRLAAGGIVLAMAGHIGTATTVYWFNKYRRGFTTVRFIDVAWPGRWDNFQSSRGRFYLDMARADLEAGRYNQGFHHLRAGLAKLPGDREARLLLAQFYAASRRTDLACRTLLDGLPHLAEDLDYLKALFSFLLAQQEDALVVEHARALLRPGEETFPRQQLLALALATAGYLRGNYDDAEDHLARHGLLQTRDGRLLALRIERDRGHADLALLRLEALAQEFPGDAEIHSTRVAWLRESGRDASARQLSLARQLEHPALPQPHIDLLYIYAQSGDARLAAAEAAVLRDFADNPEALVALADYAANTGRTDLARDVYAHFLARGYPWDATALMLVESHLVARRYAEALDITRRLLNENPEWAQRFSAVFNGLQAIAYHGLGDRESGQLFLNNFLDQANVRAENLIAVSNRLLAIGAAAPARQVLALAAQRDPLNQAALSGLIKLDLDLGHADALPGNVERLLDMRRPSRELLHRAYRELGRDRFLFVSARDRLLDRLDRILTPPS